MRCPGQEVYYGPPAAVSQNDSSPKRALISGDKLVFSPPLYVQRYEAVQEIIMNSRLPVTKVVDIGSAELKFFRNLRCIRGVQEAVLLDIDEEKLQSCKYRVQPLMADFLLRRQEPLTVKVVCGDARVYDPILSGAQAVTLIEVIEHMNVGDLPALVQCVFQRVRPHLVVVTTPNADFNKFFPNHTPGTFRHWDHKFEWTAEEFQQWCQGVVEEHPEYKVEFSGCGLGPDGTCCTQIASFWHYTQYLEQPDIPQADTTATPLAGEGNTIETASTDTSYKIVAQTEFPVDTRTKEEWEMDYALSRFNSLRNYLVTGERQDINLGPPVWQQQQEHTDNTDYFTPQPGVVGVFSPPLLGPVAPEYVNYMVPHYESEEAMYKAESMKNQNCFYIIDNRYAVIPMRSLEHWVNTGVEIDVTDELIR